MKWFHFLAKSFSIIIPFILYYVFCMKESKSKEGCVIITLVDWLPFRVMFLGRHKTYILSCSHYVLKSEKRKPQTSKLHASWLWLNSVEVETLKTSSKWTLLTSFVFLYEWWWVGECTCVWALSIMLTTVIHMYNT